MTDLDAALAATASEASVYPLLETDADGDTIDGSTNYDFHFDQDQLPPVGAFWSATMYDEEGFQGPAGWEHVSLATRRFINTDFDVVTHLFNEVIDALSPEIRDLLLRTSVVDLLSPELVELLSDRTGGDALEFLARGNQFIEPSPVGSQQGYRYQPLFRNFLRAQLAFEMPALNLELRQFATKYLNRDTLRQESVRTSSVVESFADDSAEPISKASDSTESDDPLTAPDAFDAARQLPSTDRHTWPSPGTPVPGQRTREDTDQARRPPQLAVKSVAAPSRQTLDLRTRPAKHSHGAANGSLIQPLTPKESEVLEHLAVLLPTVDIASAMFISANTVRTHIRGILRKLGVARRNEAVRRAWLLGLLPPADEARARRFGP